LWRIVCDAGKRRQRFSSTEFFKSRESFTDLFDGLSGAKCAFDHDGGEGACEFLPAGGGLDELHIAKQARDEGRPANFFVRGLLVDEGHNIIG